MKTTIVLLNNNCVYSAPIERGQEVSFGKGKKDTVFVKGFDSSQVVIKMGFDNYSVSAKKYYGIEKKNVPMDTFLILDKETKTLLFATSVISEKTTSVKLPFDCEITVGRDQSNDIVLKFPFVSSKHFTLRTESGIVRIEDNASRNGLFLNGKRISIAKMNSGDVLSISKTQEARSLFIRSAVIILRTSGHTLLIRKRNWFTDVLPVLKKSCLPKISSLRQLRRKHRGLRKEEGCFHLLPEPLRCLRAAWLRELRHPPFWLRAQPA